MSAEGIRPPAVRSDGTADPRMSRERRADTPPKATTPSDVGPTRSYHHGDLRRAVLTEAVVMITEGGPTALSVRALARRAGVAHTSVTHHFGDKAGVFAAVAAEGYRRLGGELAAVHDHGGSFLELGVAYVRFAARNRAHFEVMFRPELYPHDDPAVVAARSATSSMLYGQAGEIAPDDGAEAPTLVAGVAGWCLVHGLATLWLDGNLPGALGDDPEEITRRVARLLGPAGGPHGHP